MVEPSAANGRRVLVVSHYYDTHGGGIERVARKLIEEITGFGGFRFTWAASDCEKKKETEEDAETPEVMPANYDVLPMRAYNFLERWTGMPWPMWGFKSLRRLRKAIAEADLVWLHDAPYMGNILAFHMARWMKKPVVITQHIGTIPYRKRFWRALMALGNKFFTRRMLVRAQQVVFISDLVAEAYHSELRFTVPIKVVPNGVDANIFHPVSPKERWHLRIRFALRDNQPVVLFVGRFTEKKGLAVVEELAKLMPDWRFWLAGHGPIDPEHWNLPNVHVFRDREGESLAELYQTADLLVLPSYGEGFPLVIQESMACGLPVFCSPETAAGSQLAKPFLLTATVDPKDPARTAALWARRLKAQREFLPLEEANLELAEAAHYFWSWPKIAAIYADMIDDLIQRQDS